MIEKGNFKWDKGGKLITFAPKGEVDGPAEITSDPPDVSIDPNSGVRLSIVTEGNNTKVDVQVDKDLASLTITATQPADDPDTPITEQVSESVHFSASHSKATEFAVDVQDSPRTEPA